MDWLNDYQIGLLQDLKDWMYEQRLKARQEMRKRERAQAMAEEEAKAPEQFRLGV